MECKYYDNDEVMAQLGRTVVDQYIGLSSPESQGYQPGWNRDLRGGVSFIIGTISEHVHEGEDDEDAE